MIMRVAGASVFSKGNVFLEKDIYVKDGFITDEAAETGEVIDASDCYAIPGLIDIHFHGALGADVCDGTMDAFEKIAGYEASRGITAICPATLTLSEEDLKKVLSLGAEFAAGEHEGCAELVGFNMEGPFISASKKGAQNPNYIRRCSVSLVEEFFGASKGLLKIIGLAPEDNPGFEEYIRAVKDRVKVSIAHSNADYDTAKRAFDAGASHAVHLYNAMSAANHREPGIVGAVYDSRHVSCEIICDGIHVHPAVVRETFDMMGPERMILISDSLRSAGMPDGQYKLGGLDVIKKGKECRLAEGGNIAGSTCDLLDCMRTAVLEMGIALEKAVAAVTINPARCIGVDDKRGSLDAGKIADILLLDKKDLSIKAVYMKGTLIK